MLLQWGFTSTQHPTAYTGEYAVFYCTALYMYTHTLSVLNPLGLVHGQTRWPIRMAPIKLYVVRYCFTVYLTALPSLWEAMQASSHPHWARTSLSSLKDWSSLWDRHRRCTFRYAWLGRQSAVRCRLRVSAFRCRLRGSAIL